MEDLDAALLRIAADKLEAGEELAIITVLANSTEREYRPGRVIILDQFGEMVGGDTNQRVPEDIRQAALQGMSRGNSGPVTLRDETGIMELYIKAVTNKDKLIIVGSGILAQNIYHIASILGYHIIIVDSHPETLTRERFPSAGQLLLGAVAEQLGTIDIDEHTSIIIISQHHEADQPALQAVVKSPARYIGVLGNKRKVTEHFSQLNQMGVDERLMGRVHIPIGLDLGGQKSAEIALAVMAEVQAVKYGRPGGFLTIKETSRGIERREELF